MTQWHAREQPDSLGENEVHLWIVSLADASQQLSYFTSILSADEKERVRRFRKISDRKRYVVARGLLRRFLGRYGAGAPDRLQFTYNAFGKPSLFSAEPQTVLNFSVSHSEDQALFGFARGRRIGVDLEYVRPDINVVGLARSYFSPDEFRRFSCLRASEQCVAFYRGWTRKEAYLKALGEGLSFGIDRVEVTFLPHEPAMLNKVFGMPGGSENWTLKDLLLAPSYLGAAAVEGRSVTFKSSQLIDRSLQ